MHLWKYVVIVLTIIIFILAVYLIVTYCKKKQRKHPIVILSMTNVPWRSEFFFKNIGRLIDSNPSIDKVQLNIPVKFKRTKEAYPQIPNAYHSKIHIHRCEDLGPITKLLPTVETHQNMNGERPVVIVTLDDDIVYHNGHVDKLIKMWDKHCLSNEVYCPSQSKGLEYLNLPHIPYLEGYRGVVYPMSIFSPSIIQNLKNISLHFPCDRSDDIVLASTLLRNGISIQNNWFDLHMDNSFSESDKAGLKQGFHAQKYPMCLQKINEMNPFHVHFIFGMWSDGPMPKKMADTVKAWESIGATTKVWSPEECLKLIQEEFPSEMKTYMTLNPIQKADIARYVVIHKVGDMYCDLDCVPVSKSSHWFVESKFNQLGKDQGCLGFTEHINAQDRLTIEGKVEHAVRIANFAFYAKPKCEWLKQSIEEAFRRVKKHEGNQSNSAVLFTTGPDVVTTIGHKLKIPHVPMKGIISHKAFGTWRTEK